MLSGQCLCRHMCKYGWGRYSPGTGTVQEQQQQTLTCSKLPIKTLEKDVEHVESYQ